MAAQNFEYKHRPKNRIEMAAEFDMNTRQFRDKIKQFELDIPHGDIMPKHQKEIYEKWGYPTGVKKEWYADV